MSVEMQAMIKELEAQRNAAHSRATIMAGRVAALSDELEKTKAALAEAQKPPVTKDE